MINKKLIKEKGRDKGIKLSDLSKMLNISNTAFSLKLNNKKDFKLNEILKLKELLSISSLDEFIIGE